MEIFHVRLLLFFAILPFCRNLDQPKFGQPINNITVPLGREAIFVCVIENLSNYKVAFLRVDTQTILTIFSHVITKNHRISVNHSDKRSWFLHIRDVKESDRGPYMCQVNTDPMKNQIGYLEVVVPPNIVDAETSEDMTVEEGANVTMKCGASGYPSPSLTWRKESGEMILLNDGKLVNSVEGRVLNISGVNRLHMGAYLCIASNGVPPTVSKRIMIVVHFAPAIKVEKQLVGVELGQSAVLECLCEAYPATVNYWIRDGTEEIISPGSKYAVEKSVGASIGSYKSVIKLIVRNVTKEDVQSYRCVAKNTQGETFGTVKLYEIPSTTTTTTTTTTTMKTTTTTKATTTLASTLKTTTKSAQKDSDSKKQKGKGKYGSDVNAVNGLNEKVSEDRKNVKPVTANSDRSRKGLKSRSDRISSHFFLIFATILCIATGQ